MNSDGTELLYSTYIGGEFGDFPTGIVTDSENCAYVVGFTLSYDFPVTTGAYDTIYNGERDIIVTKLNANGSDLLYSTFIGGTNDDRSVEIAIDKEKETYIIGRTSSPDFPTTSNSFDRIYNGGGMDCFASKLNNEGSELIFSTFIGGSEEEIPHDLVIDEALNMCIEGFYTDSSDFPTTPGCFDDTYNGERDIFITKLNSEGSELIFSTYLGGSDNDYSRGICTDSENNIYITASSGSVDFPTTPGCYDDELDGIGDGIICKLNEDASALIYSTYFGGSEHEGGCGISLDDDDGTICITGLTASPDFPTTPGCFDDEYAARNDGFFLKFNIDSSTLDYSTYFGGSETEQMAEIILKLNNDVLIVGTTSSQEFPTTPGCYDDTHNGVIDVYIISFNPNNDEEGRNEDHNESNDGTTYLGILITSIIVVMIVVAILSIRKYVTEYYEEWDDEDDDSDEEF